jgi:flagellin-like hook-associated protein FlgL
MGRIGATLSGVERALLNRLADANAAITLGNLRLVTGKKINSPADNPLAFIELSLLRSRLKTVTSTLSNVTVASGLVSKTQLALDQIRANLDIIRGKALEDENQTLTVNQRAANQAAIDAAIVDINRLAGSNINGRRVLDGSANFRFSGLNPSQVADLRVYRAGGPQPVVAAEPAELTYTGSGGKIAANATFTLAGRLGSTTLSVTTSDTLADVVGRINSVAATTDVTARLDGNQLLLASVATGSTAKVAVSVGSGSFVVAGGDGAGTDFGVNSVIGSGPAISGRVLTAAAQATLAYDAGGATIAADATFTLSGKLGSTSISVTTADTLTQAADRINLKNHLTGVTAAVNGTKIELTSVDYGTKANVGVEVTSGAFAVTGGNGDGTANGTNAVAVLNGRTISGNTTARPAQLVHEGPAGTIVGNSTFDLTGSLGTATISLTDGQTLAQARDTINLQHGVTGVTASVDANNLNLIFTSDDQGRAASVKLETTAGTFGVTAGDGLALGDVTPLRAAQLIYTSADGTVSADANITLTGSLGSSAPIVITAGQTLTQVSDLINAQSGATGITSTASGNLLYLTSTTEGPAAQVTIAVNSGAFATSGGDGAGSDFGTNASSTVAGQDAVTTGTAVDGNRFTVNQGGYFYEIEFQGGFSGTFHTIEIGPGALSFALAPDVNSPSVLAVPGVQASRLGGLSGTLDQIASGGAYAGLDTNTSQALRIVDEAIGDVTRIQGAVDGFANATIASSAGLMEAFQTNLENSIDSINKVDDNEVNLLLAKNEILASNAVAGLAILAQQRMSIVDLIKHSAGLS